MKNRQWITILTVIMMLQAPTIFASVTPKKEKPTNFIVIFTDDLGYGDLGYYGAQGYQTPHLDAMAKEGMRFTDFSVSSSICTPSRAGLLTGRYAKRWGHNDNVYYPYSKDGMPASEITIAEVLKQKGYQTGIVGKWHLGHQSEYLPLAQGFDMYFGIPYSNDMWQAIEMPLAQNHLFNDGLTLQDYKNANAKTQCRNQVPLVSGNEVIEWPVHQSELTRRYTEKAQEFILQNKEKPFFLYLAHSMPHVPLYTSASFAGKTQRGLFGDVVEEIDWSVGEILKTLKTQGLDKNTLVIFTSDNGPWLAKKANAGSSGPLRDGKFSPYEGGSRVPCIVWQPGTVPQGIVSNQQTTTLDLLPTIAKIAGAALPKDRIIDGLDISAVFKGKNTKSIQRDYFLYRGDAIRVGDWKYVKDKNTEQLFNLAVDKVESKNRMAEYPDKAKELAAKLRKVQEGFLDRK